jgi:hypothetical protein
MGLSVSPISVRPHRSAIFESGQNG